MAILLTLAFLPFVWGIVNLIQSKTNKTEEGKHASFVYGKVKTAIGFISGLFLSVLYLSYDFFTGHYGFMVALIICWVIISTCNVIGYVKLGMEEYDKNHPQDNN
jgi:phosphatidylglycerophosphate synthase